MSGQKLTVFDFDNTLIKGDTLWRFLIAVAGAPATGWALLQAFISYYTKYFKDKYDPTRPENANGGP